MNYSNSSQTQTITEPEPEIETKITKVVIIEPATTKKHSEQHNSLHTKDKTLLESVLTTNTLDNLESSTPVLNEGGDAVKSPSNKNGISNNAKPYDAISPVKNDKIDNADEPNEITFGINQTLKAINENIKREFSEPPNKESNQVDNKEEPKSRKSSGHKEEKREVLIENGKPSEIPEKQGSPDHYINMAKGLREKAKPFFENKQYFEAIKVYEYALKMIGPDHIKREDEEYEEAIILQNSLLMNMSLCYSNAGNHSTALKLAKEVLKVDPYNTKAMFRVGIELKNLGYIYRAFLMMHDCREFKKKLDPNSPTDPGIEREYAFLKELVQPYLNKSMQLRKMISRKMFGITEELPEIDDESYSKEATGGIFENQSSDRTSGGASMSALRYGLYTIPAGAVGALAAGFLWKNGLKKEVSVGMGVFSSFAYYLAFISENTWFKAVFSGLPVVFAALFYLFRDRLVKY